VSARDGNLEIYTMDTDPATSDANNRTKTPGADELTPDWSPSGRRILFTKFQSGQCDLFTMRPDGSDRVRLTSTRILVITPAFSPDGKKITFARFSFSSDTEIYTMRADGTNPNNRTNNTRDDELPDWQPR
jgi:TolB protein